MEPRKITFQEAWDSASIFFVDEALEAEIDAEVEHLLEVSLGTNIFNSDVLDGHSFPEFLTCENHALEIVLRDIELSEEKFMRIVSLLRRLGRIPGGFGAGESEWNIAKIKQNMKNTPAIAKIIAKILLDGKRDVELATYIPQYYLDTLDYREIRGGSLAAKKIRYKRALIGTYSGRKGYYVEQRIRQKLEEIHENYGVPFGK